ncbi:MAG: hypothetical protein IJN48_02280, partial [Clostridia bacterium]|nr:hypothetical protein [Clostridia bacterium]
MKKVLLALLLLMCLSISVAAKETVIYENDFSKESLSDFKMRGTMSVTNGTLKAVGSGTSAFISYDIPEKYSNIDYIVEVDYLGHDGMGGLLIGATSDKLTKVPSYFSGYTATTNATGEKTYIAYFSETGWGGNFAPGTNRIPVEDIHLWVYVEREGVMTFRTTSLDGKTLFQEFRYELGDHEKDIYDTFTSTVGLRQYYADAGCFDNFKVTIVEDDVLPSMNTSVTLGDTAFKANGITAKDGVVSGNGVMLSDKALSGNYQISFSLANKNVSRVYFGMSDAKNGYALQLNEKEQELTLLKIENGVFKKLHVRANIIREGFCDVTVDVHDGIASVYYDNYFQGNDSLPKFEFYLDNLDGKFGLWLEG